MGLKYTKIKGTRDILPEEYSLWRELLERAFKILRSYGYNFIVTPTFERTELFIRSIGDTTDIVEKEMYTFTDRGGRSLTLRPEGTAPVVRAYLENPLIPPQKLAYFMNMFRAERPQKGRFREFWHLGVEFIGVRDPSADAEVVELAYRLVHEFGVKEIKLEINSIGTVEDRKRYREVLLDYLRARKDELCEDCRRRMERNPLRVLDCKIDGPKLLDAPLLTDYLSQASKSYFEDVLEYLRRWGVPFEVNKRLVRGLDYYTETAFEIKSGALGAQDSVGGGGRYDGLVEELGGPPTPAVGFALGFDRVLIASGLQGYREPLDYFIAYLGDEAREKGFEVLQALRKRGKRAEISHEKKSLKSQMKLADRLGARYALIIGDEELARDVVKVRDMETGEEKFLKPSELP
ncbi:MAG: histidine--tRNA ligase [Candidatus Hydrothermota bacterium]|nr:MAG: histidine--tRNA ligase [Candidatus Hydrothermae bacterium]